MLSNHFRTGLVLTMEVCDNMVWIPAWSYHGDLCFIPFLALCLISTAFLPPPPSPSSPNICSPLECQQAPRPALYLARFNSVSLCTQSDGTVTAPVWTPFAFLSLGGPVTVHFQGGSARLSCQLSLLNCSF